MFTDFSGADCRSNFILDFRGHELYPGEDAFILNNKILCTDCFLDYIYSLPLTSLAQKFNIAETFTVKD